MSTSLPTVPVLSSDGPLPGPSRAIPVEGELLFPLFLIIFSNHPLQSHRHPQPEV